MYYFEYLPIRVPFCDNLDWFVHSPLKSNGDECVDGNRHRTDGDEARDRTEKGGIDPTAIHKVSVSKRRREEGNENVVHKQIQQIDAKLRGTRAHQLTITTAAALTLHPHGHRGGECSGGNGSGQLVGRGMW